MRKLEYSHPLIVVGKQRLDYLTRDLSDYYNTRWLHLKRGLLKRSGRVAECPEITFGSCVLASRVVPPIHCTGWLLEQCDSNGSRVCGGR